MNYSRPIVKRHNLTERQWCVARILAENPSMDFHDLTYRICILCLSLTGILTRMEHDGLVLQSEPINDQRKFYISLTKEGQMLYDRAQTQTEEAYRQIEAQFIVEKTQQLIHLSEEFIVLGNPRQKDIPDDSK